MTDAIEALKNAVETSKLRPKGQDRPSPFRVGQVTSVDGIFDVPPTVTIGEGDLATQARLGMNIWDVNPYDTVIWIITENGVPVVLNRLPGVGSVTLLPEDADDDPDPWLLIGTDAPYVTGWEAWADPQYGVPRFRKQSDGWVSLQGLVRRTSGSSLSMFTLPEGYRPEMGVLITVMNNNALTLLHVATTGIVRMVSGYGGNPAGFVSLCGIMFPTRINPAALIYPVAEGRWSGREDLPYESPWAFLRSDGWVWWNGFLRNEVAANAGPFTIMRTDGKVTSSPRAHLVAAVLNDGLVGRFDIGGNSDTSIRGPGRFFFANANAFLVHVCLGGINYYGTVGYRQPWVNLSYLNGHTNFGADHNFGQYFRDAHGMVHLQGLVSRAAATSTVIATLPPGYRPGQRLVFHTIQNGGAGRIDVLPDGSVIDVSNSATWVSLAGVHFYAEQ